MRREILSLSVALAVSAANPVHAASEEQLAHIQQQIDALRADYEARLQDLEQRLSQAEEASKDARSTAEAAQQSAAAAESAATPAPGANALNPALSAVLQGADTHYSRDPDHWRNQWRLPGFQAGDEAGLRPEGLGLDETELTLASNVDDWLYGQATLSLHDDAISVEEAYADALALPAGLGLRFGRFFSGIGYLNGQHSHAWDFADAPLAYQAFLGGQYGDDGVRLSWLAPTDLFLELGVEVLRGDPFPGGGDGHRWLGGTHTAFAHLGGDLGTSNSWSLGLSHLWSNPEARGSEHGWGQGALFDGDSNLTLADLVWKWAPEGNATERSFVFQTEYFRRHENGVVTASPDLGGGAPFGPKDAYEGDQQGLYLQGVYQFMPRWRVGMRYDWLASDNQLCLMDPAARLTALGTLAANPTPATLGSQWLGQGLRDARLRWGSGLADGAQDPQRWTWMIDYTHSEFGRFRLQYALDESTPRTDHQWTLQYILTLGAHGAHSF